MRIDEPIDFERYGSRVAMLLVATTATRYTAETDGAQALGGFVLWIVAFFICWQVRDAIRTNRIRNTTPQKAGETVAMVGMLLFLLTLISDGILAALIAVLFALLAATIVIAERRAHVLLLLGASLAPVLFAASQSRSALFVPCAGWFTLAMLSLLTFDISAARRQSAAASPMDTRKTGHGAAMVAFIVLALALPLYLYVPQPPAFSLSGRSAQSTQDYSDPEYRPGAKSSRHSKSADKHDDSAKTASSGKPEPNAEAPPHTGDNAPAAEPTGHQDKDSFGISDVARSAALGDRIVMYVKTSQPLYLRGKLYDRFEGDRWSRSDESMTRAELDSGYLQLDPATRAGTPVTQTISIVADLGTSLYASPAVKQIRFPGPLLFQHVDGTFDVPRPLRAETTYSIDAEPRISAGRYAVDGAPPDGRYLQIDAKISARVKELAESVTANEVDPWTKALALERHLREHYAYTYETVVPYQGRTPIDWFLFDHQRGHCEFFASALAVMLREIGIPSRLANGYSLGERNPLTGFHEVHAFDGHAWVEGWLPDRGWVMFEPTPFYSLPQDRQSGQVASGVDRYLQREVETSTVLTPESFHAQVSQMLRDSWAALRNLQRSVTSFLARALPWLPALALLGALVWIALRLAILAAKDAGERRRINRLVSSAREDPLNAVLELTDALEIALSSRGLTRAIQETWREYSRRVDERGVSIPPGFADDFDDRRYGGESPALMREDIERVAASITTEINANRYPRLADQLRRWRDQITGLLQILGTRWSRRSAS